MTRKYPIGSIVFFAVVLISIIFPIASARAEDLCHRPDEAVLTPHHCYKNVDGKEVHSPARVIGPINPVLKVPSTSAKAPPVGATAICRDGDFSFSQHHSGTCSSHHGVAKWLR
jgi:hypothetical protein